MTLLLALCTLFKKVNVMVGVNSHGQSGSNIHLIKLEGLNQSQNILLSNSILQLVMIELMRKETDRMIRQYSSSCRSTAPALSSLASTLILKGL